MKINNPFDNNEKTYLKEYKGLDLVRRDWYELSKDSGKFILELILNVKKPKDEIILKILDYLKELFFKMSKNDYQESQSWKGRKHEFYTT